jgi:hypothetical protein
MWVLAAPNPTIVAVYNTTCVENGLVRGENFLEIIFICSDLF